MRLALSFISFLIFSSNAFAGLYSEFNGYFATDTFTTTATAQNSKTFYAVDIFANLESKKKFFAGFHVDQVALTDSNGTTTTTFSSLNMGPMFQWLMDKDRVFSFALGYNLLTKGTYNDGTTTTELTGTGLWATLAAMPEITETFYLGLKLNYYSLNYTKAVVVTTSSDVAYARTLIFPSISFGWRY